MRIKVGLAVMAGLVAVGLVVLQPDDEQAAKASSSQEAMVSIVVPSAFSKDALEGESLFDANCATCHGVQAVGRAGFAPPLVHKIYEPSHHGDESFQLAVARGVQAHHWSFGNMPAVSGLGRGEVEKIITYVRTLQRANGIE